MLAERPLLALLLLSCVSCETERYRWNLSHAEVHARPPLAQSDLEQIVRLVTHGTTSPIGSIVRDPPQNGREQVYVDAAATTGPVDQFILEKVGTDWKVVLHDEQWDR